MEKFQKVIIIWQNSAWKRAQNFFSPSSCCQHIFCCRFSCKATPARENSQLRVTERRNVSYQKVANPARRCSNNNVRTINGKYFVKHNASRGYDVKGHFVWWCYWYTIDIWNLIRYFSIALILMLWLSFYFDKIQM